MRTACWRILNCNHCFTKIAVFCFSLCVLIFPSTPFLQTAFASQNISPTDTDFPIYPSIKPNVDFWIDIFTKYSASQGVMHDTQNLAIVYEVVRIDPSETIRADKKNKAIKKAVTEKYKALLLNLSKGKNPSSSEEKRVAALFGPRAKLSDFKTAAFNIRCQTGLNKEFKEGLMRSGSVIDEFKRIFRSHGLPVDLVYLPCVESSFNFKAYSKFGAAGIWQFTHGTGRQYMKIDYVVDERRDPYISTDAAARLLKKNYAELGEWPLAMTAYNHGLAGMMRAKKAKGSYEKIVQSYQSRSFKFASRNFYSEFLAARSIAKNPDKYFDKISFHKPVKFQTIKTKGYLPVKELSDRLNISLQEIQALNPSLRPPVFNEQKHIPKEYTLRLPETLLITEIGKHLSALYQDRQKPSRFHRVQKGDTVSSIARLNSVRLQDLILANSLNKRATIYIGQNLRIPDKDEIILAQKDHLPVMPLKRLVEKKVESIPKSPKPIETIEPEQTVASVRTIKPVITNESEPTPEPALPAEPVAATESAQPGEPVETTEPALPGEPIQTVEEAQPVETDQTVETMEPMITMEPMNLLEAQAKPLVDEAFINPNIVTANLKILKTYQKKKQLIGVIKVEAEETLGHYADWLQIPTQEIRTLNRFKYGTPISIDQTIELPLSKKTVQEFEEQRYEYHKEIEEDFFGSFSIQGVETYEIKKGDNIWSLCLNELEIPFWLLKKYNPEINFNSLTLMQKIKYPVIKKLTEG